MPNSKIRVYAINKDVTDCWFPGYRFVIMRQQLGVIWQGRSNSFLYSFGNINGSLYLCASKMITKCFKLGAHTRLPKLVNKILYKNLRKKHCPNKAIRLAGSESIELIVKASIYKGIEKELFCAPRNGVFLVQYSNSSIIRETFVLCQK